MDSDLVGVGAPEPNFDAVQVSPHQGWRASTSMPTLPAGNIKATVVMFGGKAADHVTAATKQPPARPVAAACNELETS